MQVERRSCGRRPVQRKRSLPWTTHSRFVHPPLPFFGALIRIDELVDLALCCEPSDVALDRHDQAVGRDEPCALHALLGPYGRLKS